MTLVPGLQARDFSLASPDNSIIVNIKAEDNLCFNVSKDGDVLITDTPIGLTLDDGSIWGSGRIRNHCYISVRDSIPAPFYRAESIAEVYNAITINFRNGCRVEFRVYDDGFAYRFVNASDRSFKIREEKAGFRFNGDYMMTVPYVKDNAGNIPAQFFNSFENLYTTCALSKMDPGRLCFLPLVADSGKHKICITETNLNEYPGMYLTVHGAEKNELKAMFANYPAKLEQGGHNNLQMLVRERENWLCEVRGERDFPWRICVIASDDASLAASNLGYLLAEPSKLEDISWIRPGKVAWEWWNAFNLTGVDFKAGKNTPTYKYFIDFAAEQGIEYIIMDEGWAVNGKADLMQVNPEVNLQEILDYARQKNVGVILWAGYYAFDRDMENVCRHYAEMGVKGFKVDFMDRDDAMMTAFNYRAAQTAAKYHLLLDLHGTHKPAGLNRTWPNVLNFEGVHGLEQMKWCDRDLDQMEYDVTIPYIRQVAGPLDYTQGAMHNANRKNFNAVYFDPMSQGTRCHQLALYMVLDSPLNMLCDTPVYYRAEPQCTAFIASVPTVWDETRIVGGRMRKWIVTARRKGSDWYVGGLTNWDSRDLDVDFSFLPEGEYLLDLFRDGVNADRKGDDYARESLTVTKNSAPLRIHLAPGGGFAMKLSPKRCGK